ncbi:MAG TPA: histidine phosphatase family protein [Oceanospirillaceae bacterium]|nr:histidine phosphatase family protein [Oceanospirillaceae bacterium]
MGHSLRVTLLRHGHTTSGPVYRGRVDSPLSDKGWQQMQEAVASISPDLIITSPLQRCAKFADYLEAQMNVEPGALVVRDERLLEMDFGDWDGRDREEVWQQDADSVKAFWADPMHVSPPNGENLSQVQDRAAVALHDYIATAIQARHKHLLLISHGGVIRCLLGKVLHMSGKGLFHLHVPYAGLAHLQVAHYKVAKTTVDEYHISLDLGAATA